MPKIMKIVFEVESSSDDDAESSLSVYIEKKCAPVNAPSSPAHAPIDGRSVAYDLSPDQPQRPRPPADTRPSLNDARWQDIKKQIHGLGASLAQAIVKNGPYNSWNSVQKKNLLIGEKRIEALRGVFKISEDEPEAVHPNISG